MTFRDHRYSCGWRCCKLLFAEATKPRITKRKLSRVLANVNMLKHLDACGCIWKITFVHMWLVLNCLFNHPRFVSGVAHDEASNGSNMVFKHCYKPKQQIPKQPRVWSRWTNDVVDFHLILNALLKSIFTRCCASVEATPDPKTHGSKHMLKPTTCQHK